MQMKQQEKLIPVFFLALAILFGVFIRIYAAWKAGFPMVDGGMFLTMARDLQASHYFLPAVTSYNHLQIPYAYPPLGFYLLAGINNLFGISLLSLIQWLPAIFSALTIPAFALLAHRILGTKSHAALATLIYALTPQAFEWQLMGGGLTRALGALFAILVIYFSIRMFQDKTIQMLAATILTGALTVYSHPEWALQAAAAGILVWAFFGRNKPGTYRALAAGVGILALTAPWWATVVARQGLYPFLVASQTSQGRWLFWWPLITMNFSGVTNIMVAGLGLIAIFICLKNKKYFLPVWLVVCFLTDMRSAGHVIPIQLALLATITLCDMIFPWFMSAQPKESEQSPTGTRVISNYLNQVLLAYLFIALLANSFSSVSDLATFNILPVQDRQAMDWVRQNTPAGSRFVVIGWQDSPWVSPLTEWFPALSERFSLTTVQGREWLPGDQNVNPWINNFEEVQSCLYQTISCLQDWSGSHTEPYNYVYISLHDPSDAAGVLRSSSLYLSLSTNQNYELVYNGATVKITGVGYDRDGNDINSDVQTIEVFGIFDPFGAGKTTTIKMIVALMPNPKCWYTSGWSGWASPKYKKWTYSPYPREEISVIIVMISAL